MRDNCLDTVRRDVHPRVRDDRLRQLVEQGGVQNRHTRAQTRIDQRVLHAVVRKDGKRRYLRTRPGGRRERNKTDFFFLRRDHALGAVDCGAAAQCRDGIRLKLAQDANALRDQRQWRVGLNLRKNAHRFRAEFPSDAGGNALLFKKRIRDDENAPRVQRAQCVHCILPEAQTCAAFKCLHSRRLFSPVVFPKRMKKCKRFEKKLTPLLTEGEKHGKIAKKERDFMSEMIRGKCPHCGKKLEIPAELTEFSCLYCGERMTVSALYAPKNADELSRELDYVRKNLLRAVTEYPDYYTKLSKRDFFPAFEAYESANAEVLQRLDDCARVQPDGGKALIEQVCGELLEDVRAFFDAESKRKRQETIFSVKVVLAVFLTPLARKLELETAELFRKELYRQWKVLFPKEEWTPGDYEVLAGGFRKRKWCFITTATCLHEGKPDDCAELTSFRSFRDGWLAACPDGAALIDEYYAVAPAVVACIDYCDAPEERYAEIRQRWLSPCYAALQEERFRDCRDLYVEMVQTLRERYLLS